MSRYRATGKVCTLGTVYNSLDPAFKRVVDQIIDNKGDGHCLLRLLRLTSTTQTPTTLLSLLLKKYDRENHYFEINGHHLNVTLEDILYLTGLPIDGKAVISSTSRDKEAFERVFTSFDRNEKVTVPTLKKIVETQSKEDKERLIALLLIVIVCFVTPVCDDYIVHNYLVQFVEKLDEVDGYAWGAALLSTFYCAIENKKKSVDANCWPLLAFFCIRIPKLCEALGFHINLENLQVHC
ncbi:putative aminotransferase-like, plant mobile domain-containing protein [Helianthus annuus]|nr:putative aminotransferase-like, plant mobile domain-containing protein [Helianthus annuus]